MTNRDRTRAQTCLDRRRKAARLHLARLRQALTGNYWRSRQPDPEPARTTPKDPEQAARAERLMALLRGEGGDAD